VTAESDVELVHVTKRYGDVVAVNDISLQVCPGEFLTLLGPSGSGKTTILRMVGGFEAVSAGDVLIKGRTMTGEPPHRRDTSMVFQDYALFPHKSVGENIAFGLKMRGVAPEERRRRVQGVLDLVDLPGVAHRMPYQLSGGQRQRVALARSLVIRPSVLLLDEPLGALDAQIRKHMQVEIKTLQQRLGLTFLYVTHDQEEAMVISDRIAILRDGVLEQIGPPEEVYERPASRFVASFLGECNLLTGVVRALRDAALVIDSPEIGPLQGSAPRLSQALVSGQAVTIGIRPERMRIGWQDGDHANSKSGRVHQAAFSGTVTRYTIRVGGADIVVAALGPKAHSVGDEVTLSWAVEDTIVIPGPPCEPARPPDNPELRR
jgi:spermidine/putrescine ABC transporter ATP-binding subunit